MGVVERKDVIGFMVGEDDELESVCSSCITKEEMSSIEEDDIMMDAGDEDIHFAWCDRCKKLIK